MKHAMRMTKGAKNYRRRRIEEYREKSTSRQHVILPLPGPIKPVSP